MSTSKVTKFYLKKIKILYMVEYYTYLGFYYFLMGWVGFEPTLGNPTDLQSVSLDHSDTNPFLYTNYFFRFKIFFKIIILYYNLNLLILSIFSIVILLLRIIY